MIKKILLPLLALAVLVSCKDSGKEEHGEHGHEKEGPKSEVEALFDSVMEAHNVVMPKMGKVRGAQDRAKQLLDSISALPAKAQAGAAGLKTRLEALVNDLNYADFAMDKWMTEFNMDSAKEDVKARTKYLLDEQLKVNKVKEAVMAGLARADSLLKK